jgi:hypothetical protein
LDLEDGVLAGTKRDSMPLTGVRPICAALRIAVDVE